MFAEVIIWLRGQVIISEMCSLINEPEPTKKESKLTCQAKWFELTSCLEVTDNIDYIWIFVQFIYILRTPYIQTGTERWENFLTVSPLAGT